jgi:hypothetical protein
MASTQIQSGNGSAKQPTFLSSLQTSNNFIQKSIEKNAAKELNTPTQPAQDTYQAATQQQQVASQPRTERIAALNVFAGRATVPTPSPSNNPFVPVKTQTTGLAMGTSAIAHSDGSNGGGSSSQGKRR